MNTLQIFTRIAKKSIATIAKQRKVLFLLTLIAGAMCSSCGSSKDVVYVQDLPERAVLRLQEGGELRLQPGDRVSIVVHSRDKEVASMFNLANNTDNLNQAPNSKENSTNFNSYTVDENGKIDMPVLGLLPVEGLTRLEVAQLVKYRLLAGNLLRDPTVSVEFPSMSYYVIGESGVGRHQFPTDKLNIMEALAIAGDLNITGNRTNILVMRTENGQQVPYRVDLTRADEIYASPVYYLRQNDMIYVEPTVVRQNEATANGNTLLTPSFWMSLITFGISVAVLCTK